MLLSNIFDTKERVREVEYPSNGRILFLFFLVETQGFLCITMSGKFL